MLIPSASSMENGSGIYRSHFLFLVRDTSVFMRKKVKVNFRVFWPVRQEKGIGNAFPLYGFNHGEEIIRYFCVFSIIKVVDML